jgi:hypothetical protein
MMTGIDTVAFVAVWLFIFLAGLLMLFMAAVQPIWCVIDCAVDDQRSGAGKAFWIIVLVLLWGVASWFYGAFAADGAWLRRLTRLAWLVAIVAFVGFIALMNTSDGFRRGIEQQWQKRPNLVLDGAGAARAA